MKISTLKKKKEFDKVFKKGKSFANRNLVVYYLENQSKENKFGIVISKKVGKAHIRNYLRRIIKENLRRLGIKKGYDILIIVRKGSDQMDYKEMRRSLIHVFKKIGFLKK